MSRPVDTMGGAEEEECCAICFEPGVEKMDDFRCPHAHMFHKECIERWKESNNSCPLCRMKMFGIAWTHRSWIENIRRRTFLHRGSEYDELYHQLFMASWKEMPNMERMKKMKTSELVDYIKESVQTANLNNLENVLEAMAAYNRLMSCQNHAHRVDSYQVKLFDWSCELMRKYGRFNPCYTAIAFFKVFIVYRSTKRPQGSALEKLTTKHNIPMPPHRCCCPKHEKPTLPENSY